MLILAEKGFVSLDVDKIKVLLSQVDDAIAQDNADEDSAVEFTPEMLDNICEDLQKALENTPEPQNKDDKEKLREKKRQLKDAKAAR